MIRFAAGFAAGAMLSAVLLPNPQTPAGVDVVVYEDGSGVQHIGDAEVRIFPAGTFVWRCQVDGNRAGSC